MANYAHFKKLENMMHSAPFIQLTGDRAVIKQGEAEITLPVKQEFFHSAGAMHGALYFLALDNAAFFAVNSLVEDVFVLTISFTTYLTRPVTSGTVRSVGRVLSQNHTQFIAEAVLYDSSEKEIAIASGLFVRSKIPLSKEIGYENDE
jgi:uncharacterized protein (TIGR00369 family)